MSKRICCLLAGMVMYMALSAQHKLTNIVVEADSKVLNPVLEPGAYAHLRVRGIFDDGRTMILPAQGIVYGSKNKLASGNDPVIVLDGNKAIPKEGGIATITAVADYGGRSLANTLDIAVRPYYREYQQTLVLKLFMGMEGEPVAGIANEPLFRKPHDVICTFAQALEVIRKTDNLTQGIPKIIYLVGWQKGGHDHLYPSWDIVNPKLKRSQDSTALESLRWLIREARRYHTTVSLHINMVDAYKSSPLWDEYVKKDVIGRDKNGRLLARSIQIKGDSVYIVSYTREWAEGLAQRRIDRLIAMIPELKEGHTIHIDVFIDKLETEPSSLSPWHALPQNGGIDMYKEAETQRKIFKYWRARGFDVTGEGIFWAQPPGEGFYGLQPMSWWYPSDTAYQLATPEYLSARGSTDRHGDGDFRFGNSMHGEDIYIRDIDSLPGFLGQFCRNTLPWYYLCRLERLALIRDTLFYSGGLKAAKQGMHNVIWKGKFVLRDNDDLFVPALWKKQEIIAYSQLGYSRRSWVMPEDWLGINKVNIYKITLHGRELIEKGKQVTDGRLTLSLHKEEAVSIVPGFSE